MRLSHISTSSDPLSKVQLALMDIRDKVVTLSIHYLWNLSASSSIELQSQFISLDHISDHNLISHKITSVGSRCEDLLMGVDQIRKQRINFAVIYVVCTRAPVIPIPVHFYKLLIVYIFLNNLRIVI
jgi:hypothetical protein